MNRLIFCSFSVVTLNIMHAVFICTQNTKVKQPLHGGSTFVWIEMLMDGGLRDIKKKKDEECQI